MLRRFVPPSLRETRLLYIWWIAGALGLALIMTLVGARFVVSGQGAVEFIGADLDRGQAADFNLTNQFGQLVSLSDQRGKVTVLTFLYTNCPDICPLTTVRLRSVHEQLGADAKHVALLAVSVDPEHDTLETARTFSERLGMLDRWSYLVGDRADLEPVWAAYYIGVAEDGSGDSHEHSEERSEGRLIHTAPIYLIDGDGQLRSLHTTGGETDAIIDDVLHDIRALLNED